MFKITTKYKTLFDNTETTKDLYFNLTKGELAKIHMATPGGLLDFMDRISEDPEWDDVESVFERIILTAYGKRTATGKFIKSKELREEFAASDAYSEVFLMFLNNEDNFIDRFLEGCLNVSMDEVKKATVDLPAIANESTDF